MKMEEVKPRETWANKVEVFLSVLGYIIGLGNIWRFPYMAYKNGGGAFLIPYSLCAIVIGLPMFFLETALGQFMKRGTLKAWNIVPVMKGVGLGSLFIAIYCNTYYILVMAWAILYFFITITHGTLPWTTCDNWWNSENCMTYNGETQNVTVSNQTVENEQLMATTSNSSMPSELSVVEYWNNFVLRKTSGLEDMGTLENWPLILSFLGAWVVCYFCTFKGVKSTGKVVYFTATFPYFVLLIMLVKGCTLPGAVDGIKFYLEPNITRLADPQVWVDAASQIVYTYGICFATLITFASYNEFNHDCLKHSVKLVIACSLTSFVTGFAVFTVVGNLAHVQNITVADLELSGPGLIFLVFPTALSNMPLPNMWNAFFFFMIIIIGIDSQFSAMEVVTTVVYDQWSHLFTKKYRREFMVLGITLIYIIIGIPLVMEGGIYVFELYNNYAVGGIALIWLTMMEAIGIAHIYGADRFCEDIELMIGYKVTTLFKICIMWVTPLLTGSILFFYVIQYAPPVVDKVYHYSAGAQVVGWMMTMSSFLCIPGYAIYRVYISKGDTLVQKFREAARARYPSHVEKYRAEKERKESQMEAEQERFVEKSEIFPVECITAGSEEV